MRSAILFVDDDIQILRSLNRLFLGSIHRVYTAESGEIALKILDQTEISLLVTDIRMPGMDGYQLLREVKSRYPSIPRLVLSGNVEETIILKLQQNCLAKIFLHKPWKNQELIRIIDGILEVGSLMNNKRMLETINELEFLSSPPVIYHQFTSLIEQDADLADIAALIEKDPAITAKVLQVANSAIYGFKTGSVRQAISHLGLNNVKNLILAVIMFNQSSKSKHGQIQKHLNDLWLHAVSTDQIFAYLYRELYRKKVPETYAMAGLLHDLGIAVLLSRFPDRYIQMPGVIESRMDQMSFVSKFDSSDDTHSDLGGYLLNWWELPYPLIEASLFHHNPLDSRVIDQTMVALVHIADLFSWNNLTAKPTVSIDDKILDILQMNSTQISQLYAAFPSSRNETAPKPDTVHR